MSTRIWKGDASPIAQVVTLTVATPNTADKCNVAIGDKVLTVAVADTTPDDTAAAIVAAWSALPSGTWPEFSQLIPTAVGGSSGQLTVTANTPGVPFILTASVTGSGGTAFTASSTMASSGPNDWSTAANWSGGAVPVTGDTVIFQNTTVPCLYGLAQSSVQLAALEIYQSCQSPFQIGLPLENVLGYYEYLPTALEIGVTAGSIGYGPGSGCGKIKIDTGTSNAASWNIFNSGTSSESGVPAVLLAGSHSGNVLNVLKGDVGAGFFPSDVARFDTIVVGYVSNPASDASLQIGSQVTLGAIAQSGGNLTFASNVTTFNQDGNQATANITGTATVGTLTVDGTVNDSSTGTITTLAVIGTYNAGQLVAGKTITNVVTLIKGCAYLDPFGNVTLGAGFQCVQCVIDDVTIQLPQNKTFTWA